MLRGIKKIALIHDELTRRGGAEIVFEELAALFPQADLFTLYAGRPVLRADDKLRPLKTSYLQRWPTWMRRHPGRMLPFLPHAAEQFDFSGYEAVISSASAFAKAIITRSNVPHICYCHTPTRYLWDEALTVAAARPRPGRLPLQWLQHYLRLMDFTAAQRVDVWLANSEYTRARIAKFYRRASQVIYPPIDVEFYYPAAHQTKSDFFLAVGRLTPMKQLTVAIRVCEKLELPLVIVGQGLDEPRLRKLARQYGGCTRFIRRISKKELREYYRSARALIQPGVEDFGMAAAEALACGTPVIALGRGGVKEMVQHEQTGILYDLPHEEGLADGIRQFLTRTASFDPAMLAQSVRRFRREIFHDAIYKVVADTIHSSQVKTYGIYPTSAGDAVNSTRPATAQ